MWDWNFNESLTETNLELTQNTDNFDLHEDHRIAQKNNANELHNLNVRMKKWVETK